MTILVAYDGTPAGGRIIEAAAALFPAATAYVAHVRQPAVVTVPVAAPGVVLAGAQFVEDDSEHAAAALRVAEEGAAIAEAAGLRAIAVTGAGAGTSGIAERLISESEERGAEVIVVGARSHSGLVAALLGSVCDGVVHKATLPVLVVPHE